MQNGTSDTSFNMNVVKVGINGTDSDICISDEMTKTSVWKHLVANESSPSLNSNSSSIKWVYLSDSVSFINSKSFE